MPRLPIDYSNTCFYKIICKDLSVTDIYVGHTTDFTKRKAEHRLTCNNEHKNRHNLKVYHFIREHGGWDNFDMILIERISCSDKLEACKLERQYIEELQATLNSYIPTRTKPEYYQDNKERTLEKVKSYYKDNKDKCLEWKNTKFECACGGRYANATKARHEKTEKHQEYLKSLEDD